MERNKEKKSSKKISDWKEFYKSEEKKYIKYIETTKISNLTELTQQLSKNIPTRQILTDY